MFSDFIEIFFVIIMYKLEVENEYGKREVNVLGRLLV